LDKTRVNKVTISKSKCHSFGVPPSCLALVSALLGPAHDTRRRGAWPASTALDGCIHCSNSRHRWLDVPELLGREARRVQAHELRGLLHALGQRQSALHALDEPRAQRAHLVKVAQQRVQLLSRLAVPTDRQERCQYRRNPGKEADSAECHVRGPTSPRPGVWPCPSAGEGSRGTRAVTIKTCGLCDKWR